MQENVVIYGYVRVPIRIKERHITKIGKRVCNSFHDYFGDIPICRYNDITRQWEPVANYRGWGYAGRKRQMYRKKKRD